MLLSKSIIRCLCPKQGPKLTKVWFSTKVEPVKMTFDVFQKPETDKNATPIVIMHGLFGSKQNWRSIGRALESKLKRRVYTVDARNHGDSPHTPEHDSEHMAADVVELMKSESIPKACVVGHSMGGRTMMYLALKFPDLVDRGVIVDISPLKIPRDFFHMEQILLAMKNISVPSDLTMAQGRVVVERQIKEAVGDQETVNFIMLNLRKGKSGDFFWATNVDTLHKNLRSFGEFKDRVYDLPSFKGSMMFICGKHSNFVEPDSWPDIQKIFPNSEIHWLDAGHLVHFEQPHQFIDLVVKFVNR